MATQFEEVDVGPFVGGLNTLSDQTSIADTELFQCVNFELDQDGSLVSRPPIRLASSNAIPAPGQKAVQIIGYYVDSATQAVYLIANNKDSGTYYYANGNWTLITATFAATACTQFRDKLYLVAPLASANPGGTWAPAGGFVADANQPKGVCIVSNKERLWIAQGKNATANGSRVYVTDIVGGLPTWNGNFITVSSGDGQNVVDLAVYNSDLVIFKQSSTYRFSFGSDVASGYISPVSQTIGATDTGCYAVWEQQIYVVFNNAVYEFTNYLFSQLNITVPLETANPAANLTKPISISAWANRIFVSYFDTAFVYNLRNRTWSQWSSAKIKSFGRFYPFPFQQSERPMSYLYSSQPISLNAEGVFLYQVVDVIEPGIITDPSVSEPFTCTLETKNYDYQSQSKWKRLGWWGADVMAHSGIQVFAQPVQYASSITWGAIKAGGYTWGDRKAGGYTWGRPVDPSVVVVDAVQTGGSGNGRKFIKFLKSLRFRQISFKLVADTHGTLVDAPVHVYALSTYVREKELVAKKIN